MPFQFSDVLIPFKSSVDAAIKGINTLKTTMLDLGKTVAKVETAINGKEVDKFGNSLKVLDFRTMRAIDRLSLLVVMSRNVRTALDETFGAASLVSKGFESAAEGVMVFTSFAMLARDNMGLLAAGLAGVATAIFLFVSSWVQANIKANDASTDMTTKMDRVISEMGENIKDATAAGKAFGDTFGELASRKLAMARSEFEGNFKEVRKLKDELVKLNTEVSKLEAKEGLDSASLLRIKNERAAYNDKKYYGGLNPNNPWIPNIAPPSAPEPSTALTSARQQVESMNRALEAFQKRQQDLLRDASILKLADQTEQYSTKLKGLNEQLAELNTLGPTMEELAQNFQAFADFGIDTTEQQKIANATQLLRIKEQILKTTILQNDADLRLQLAMEEKKRAGLLLDPEEQLRLEQLQTGQSQRSMNQENAVKGTQDALAKLVAAEAPGKFTKSFTVPFTNAVGDAVINGILQGQKGAEILANTLSNLLGNGLNEAMKQFQQGMIDVFKSIAGAGGELLGSALTMVVGVVAGVLGKKASSTDNFERIKSQIESTQAVRGVVAGPTNVAIAAVGENLKRALAGVEARLDVMIQLMVRGNQGLLPYAGSVATP